MNRQWNMDALVQTAYKLFGNIFNSFSAFPSYVFCWLRNSNLDVARF